MEKQCDALRIVEVHELRGHDLVGAVRQLGYTGDKLDASRRKLGEVSLPVSAWNKDYSKHELWVKLSIRRFLTMLDTSPGA